jgi:arabinan endo-1,5-alpha-L-arabinosidase
VYVYGCEEHAMTRWCLKTLSLQVLAVLIVFLPLQYAKAGQADTPRAIPVQGDVVGAHDPSIAKDGDTFYLFTTTPPNSKTTDQFPIRCSKDLVHWKACGYVFPEIPAWIKKDSPKTKELWAPDISFFDGKFHLYYAYSAFGVNTSGVPSLQISTFTWTDGWPHAALDGDAPVPGK